MFFTSLKNTIFSRLVVKSTLSIILLISGVTIILASFLILRMRSELITERLKAAQSLAQSCAYNSRDHILKNNTAQLIALSKAVARERDIYRVNIINSNGKIIGTFDYSLFNDKFFEVLLTTKSKDSIPVNTWTNSGQISLRTFIPIEINRSQVKRDNNLLWSFINNTADIDSLCSLYPVFGFPCFSPDGSEIIFQSHSSNHTDYLILSMDINSKKLKVLIEGGAHPCWSNNGRYLAFINENSKRLCVYDTKSGLVNEIWDKGIGRMGCHCFSHDDRYLITTLEAEHNDQASEKLFRIAVDGGIPEQLTFHEGQHWNPSCSSDGKWMLYTDVKNGIIYKYNMLTGSSSRVFPHLDTYHSYACFSPDGHKFVYSALYEGVREIFCTDFHPHQPAVHSGVPLIKNDLEEFNISWSPDNELVAFSHYRDETDHFGEESDIYLVSVAGGKTINLTQSLIKTELLGYVVMDVNLDDLYNDLAHDTFNAILITLGIIGVGSLLTILILRKTTGALNTLAKATESIAQGNLEHTVQIKSSDEIGLLADSFNLMVRNLNTAKNELETLNRDLETRVAEQTTELKTRNTELKMAYNGLDEAYKKLQTLDKTKDDFLSLVSHEIRTPLASISIHAEMLQNRIAGSEEERKLFQSNIVEDCEHLTRLVNNVLDLSKIEAGRMPFNFKALNIKDLVNEVYTSFKPAIDKKSVHFSYNSFQSGIRLRGDKDRIIQVLTNIISNAVKFTPADGTVSVSLSHDTTTGTVAVRDTGKGIRREDIAKVFDKFSQLENINHHSEGTGLGMTISKSIIENHGGDIWIESEVGLGTTVYFSLPLAETITDAEEKPVVKDVSLAESNNNRKSKDIHKSILIADDEKKFRTALKGYLKHSGYESVEASGGNETLQLIKKHHPALVILDVMMPDMSGLDVCRIIKNDQKTRGIKVIILSARGQEKEKEEGLQAGADRYITKPFNYQYLLETIEELLKK